MSLYDDVVLPDLGIKINPSLLVPENATKSSSTTPATSSTQQQANNKPDSSTPSTTASTTSNFANWNSNSLKFLQNQVETARKRQQLNSSLNKPHKPLNSAVKPPTAELTRKSLGAMPLKPEQTEIRFNSLTGKIEREDESLFASLAEEYDPMKPNDYEKLVKHLKPQLVGSDKQKKPVETRRASRSRSRERRRRRRSASSSSRSRSSSDDSQGRSKHRKKRSDRHRKRRGSSGAGSSSGGRSRSRSRSGSDRRYSDENSSSNKKVVSNNQFAPPPSLLADTSVTSDTKADGLLKAEKMMKMMGYKEGEGLGKNKQGISMALQVEKTGVRSGRIIHEKEMIEAAIQAKELQQQQTLQASIIPPVLPAAPSVIAPSASIPSQPATSVSAPAQVGIPADIMKNMSKVILLRNMVDPGDIDDDLEGETKEECQKYGEVSQVIIFELPKRPPEEAVRIFIEFKTLPSAIKALTDLNGRFFGGRRVKASFYNYDKFKQLELADEVV